MARVFLYALIISYRSGFAKLSRQLDRGASGRFVPSVCQPYQRQSKRKAKCTRIARPCVFPLSLILPGQPTDVKPPDALPSGLRPQGCASRSALRSRFTVASHHRAGLATLARCHARRPVLARLSRPCLWLRPCRLLSA